MNQPSDSRPLKAMLVEDSDSDAILVQRLVDRCAIAIDLQIARDGEEALRILREQAREAPDGLPRFILLDLSLPRLGGIGVLTKIKSEPALSDIPVIILSGSERDEDIRRGQELKAHTHLLKPMNINEFTWIARSIQSYWPRLEKLRLLE